MKLYLLLVGTLITALSCSKNKGSTPQETDTQKAAKIAWIGYSQLTVSKNGQGQVFISMPISVSDTTQLKTLNLYIQGSQLLYSKDKPKSGNIGTFDLITNWSTTKTQTYNFEFVLNDDSKLKLENFTVTP